MSLYLPPKGMTDSEMPIVDGAMALGLDYHTARRLLLRGVLKGRRTECGRFVVSRESVEAMRQKMGTSPQSAA